MGITSEVSSFCILKSAFMAQAPQQVLSVLSFEVELPMAHAEGLCLRLAACSHHHAQESPG